MGKIVWLASYPKSGNTWVRAFLHNYITQSDTPQNINALTDFSVAECAAAFFHAAGQSLTTQATQRLRPGVHKSLTELHDDLVFVKTHNANLAVHEIPLCTPAQSAGAIHIVRDPRDVVLSYSAFLGKPVDDIIAFMANPRAANRATPHQVFEFLASWSIHTESWLNAKNTFLVRYEDLATAPETYFGRLINFLGGDPAPSRLTRAIAQSDFKILAAQEREVGYKAGLSAGGQKFFRAGKVADWRNILTPEQTAQIEETHATTMKKLNYL